MLETPGQALLNTVSDPASTGNEPKVGQGPVRVGVLLRIRPEMWAQIEDAQQRVFII
jgi:hypothetical protein